MNKTDMKYKAYIQILEEELKPAMGCTEPISLAYAAAVAAKYMDGLPDKVLVEASGSIIKNVKSVIVPNTNHMKGIPVAAAVGIIAGNPDKELEVLADVTPEQIAKMQEFLQHTEITTTHIELGCTFDIIITLYQGEHYVKVRIANDHTNVVLIEKDGEKLKYIPVNGETNEGLTDRTLLNLADIYDFANTVDVEDLKHVLDPQIKCNMAIAEEGLRNNYGANIGSVLLKMAGENPDVRTRARAMAAAGSDARMNGCEMPVVICSGSGNQGMTTSIPVIVYAQELKVSEEKLYRALALANLVTIHEKTPIGVLSAFCGAVSAGAGAGAGIAYLHDATLEEIGHTITNAVGVTSGMICDGAKASCAGKIANSVEAGIIGYNMCKTGNNYQPGDGIVGKDVEETLANVGTLAKKGMEKTNEVIIDIMIKE